MVETSWVVNSNSMITDSRKGMLVIVEVLEEATTIIALTLIDDKNEKKMI